MASNITLDVKTSQAFMSRRGFLRNAAMTGAGLAGLGLAGCASSSDEGSSSGSAATSTGDIVSGGTLTFSLPSSPSQLDPVDYTGTYESQIINMVCDTLVDYSMDLTEIVPCLATEWTISDDGLTYTFTLRDDAYFTPGEYQDGRLMTADDVKYSLERSNELSAMNRLDMLDHCNVISDTEIECVLTTPASSFLTCLTDAGNVIIPQEEVDGWGDSFGHHLIGTGPFVMDEFIQDQETDFSRSDTYWGEASYLDNLVITVITDMSQAANALATGEIDMATSLTGESIEIVSSDDDLILDQTQALHFAYVYMNQVNGACADQNVRKAILMAVNRDDLIAGVYPYGEAEAAVLPLPKLSWGYDESIEADVPEYDPEAAMELLTEAGYGDGLTLTLAISNTEARQKMATILQDALKTNLNIDLEVTASDWGTFSTNAASGEFDMYGMSWTWYPDPYFFLNKLFHSSEIGGTGNGAGFDHEEVDDLLDQALQATDQDERAALYQDALRAIVSYDPILVYSSEYINTGLTQDVVGYTTRSDNKIIICNSEVNVSKADGE